MNMGEGYYRAMEETYSKKIDELIGERDALKAELAALKPFIDDRLMWKSRAAKYRSVLEKLAKAPQCTYIEDHAEWGNADDSYEHGSNVAESHIAKQAQEALADDVALDAARTKEMERGMMG